MIKSTTFKNIGFSDYATARIEIEEIFSPSNDYEGTIVYVDNVEKANASGTREAVENAIPDRSVTEFIFKHL